MLFDIKSDAYRHDPYATFKRLRTDQPVCRISPFGHWAVARYHDVEMILKNPAVFSSAGVSQEPDFTDPQFLLLSRGLLGTDGADHTRLRRALRKAFTPAAINGLEPIIRRVCASLASQIARQQTVDFVQAFAIPLPIAVVSALLDIDSEKQQDFKRWVDLLLTWRNHSDISYVLGEAQQMMRYFTHVIAKRREKPGQDLISHLILASDNQQITYEEVISFIRLILVAGTDTTTSLLANGMLALTKHPYLIKTIVDDIAIIPDFIEEIFRYDSPTISLSRRATEETEIAGVTIHKHELVLPLVASANHDESVFKDPEDFIIARNTRHLGLGTGVHYCLGSQLARLQTRIAFEELFKVVSRFKRIDHEPLPYLNSFFFRSLRSLKLAFISS